MDRLPAQESRGRPPATREYGTASSEQAAIRLTERLLPLDAEYVVTTLARPVHQGRTPPEPLTIDRGRYADPRPSPNLSRRLLAWR
jgi:hypothetical protein